MAIIWGIKTEIVNVETDLRKIYAIRTDDVMDTLQSFFVKGITKTPEDRKKIWDNIWTQYLEAKAKIEAVDIVAVAMKNELEKKEPVK